MIELIVLDVDGTLTDGKIFYTDKGEEIKAFNIKDGLMVASWNRLGKKSAIITGRNSKIVERRAKELGITYVIQGERNKSKALKEILQKENLTFSQIAIIGDDLNDLSMMKLVNKTFAPVDANPYIYDYVSNPLTKKGGDGAVAEMVEIILKEENLYNKFLELWEE